MKTADKENYGLLFDTLSMWGVSKNKYANGCVFEDGSIIFTSSGGKENGNPLYVNEEICGRRLVYRGQDYLGIRLGDKGEILEAAFTRAESLMIDGHDHIKDGKLILIKLNLTKARYFYIIYEAVKQLCHRQRVR